MPQIASLWNALTPQRRIIIIGATLTVFVAMLLIARAATTADKELLYAGLDADTAGEVVAALEQRDIAFEVRGDSIHVDARARDEVRMSLAAEGLPGGGARGYELLDDMSGFGTTTQMFDAAYWRAKEGELARTIVTDRNIESARVHIAAGRDQPFRRSTEASASVQISTRSGSLDRDGARALRHLVAAAVPDLAPQGVHVIDSDGGLIAGDDGLSGVGGGDERAEALAGRVERLLEASLGRGRAIVEASVEIESESESIHERIVDPDQTVTISSDTVERASTATNSGGDDVTVASNLPDGDAAEDGNASMSQSDETEARERINFEISETRREILRAPGDIRRLTIAAMVDGETVLGDDGAEAWSPRGEEELAALRGLIAAAVGFDEARGDVITLESMPLAETEIAGTQAESPGLMDGGRLDMMSLIQLGALTLVALVVAMFVLRPAIAQALAPRPEAALEDPRAPAQLPATRDADSAPDAGANLPALTAAAESAGGDPDPDDPAARLRALIDRRQGEAVEILRGWMEDRSEERG